MITTNRTIINRSSIADLVVIVWGQSNTGNAPTSEAPSYITTSADIPNCTIWYPGDSSWANLRLGTNGSHTGSPTSKQLYSIVHELGYQLGLVYPGKRIRFIMAAVGGTPMNTSSSDGYWRSDAAQQLYRVNLFGTIPTALATLSSYVILGTLGFQGESDSSAAENAARYGMLEKHFYDSYKRDFSRHKLISFKLPLINPASFPYKGDVNTGKQLNYTNGHVDAIIDTDDCTVSGDGLHLNGSGLTAAADKALAYL